MYNRELLQKTLMNDNIIQSVNNNIDILLEIIPELKDMMGFQHNHPDKLEKRIKYLKIVFEYIKQIDNNIDKKIKIKI